MKASDQFSKNNEGEEGNLHLSSVPQSSTVSDHDHDNTFSASAVVHRPFTVPEKYFQKGANDAESEYVIPEVSIDEPYAPLTSELITVQSCEEKTCDIGSTRNNTTEPCSREMLPEKCFQKRAIDVESEYVVPEVSIDEPYAPLTSQLITVPSCEEKTCDIGTRSNVNTTEKCGTDDDDEFYLVPEIYEEIEGLADTLPLTERARDTSPSQSNNEGQNDNITGNGNDNIYETPL